MYVLAWLSRAILGALAVVDAHAEETVYEAALIARNLIQCSQTSVATMATIFPPDHPTLPDEPFALQEYYASCYANGSLSLLFLPISRHSQNILHSANHSVSITVQSSPPAASRARVSLIGTVTIFSDGDVLPDEDYIRSCYLGKHPDARWWLPHDKDAAHVSYWARFDPKAVYFVGGFGDQHYIGHIPIRVYQNAFCFHLKGIYCGMSSDRREVAAYMKAVGTHGGCFTTA